MADSLSSQRRRGHTEAKFPYRGNSSGPAYLPRSVLYLGKEISAAIGSHGTLLIDTLLHYRQQGEYKLHAFVVMRDHFHALLTIQGEGTIERVMQKIKGGFSYRARAELGFRGEIWQRGFTDERVWDAEQFISVRKYIHDNPVPRGMVAVAEDYPFSSAHAKFRKPQGLKPSTS